MGKEDAANQPLFGFFSVASLAGGSLVGGYLLVNELGRPVEFHCTEAVKATRAQEILYGPTLAPFLHADQLGRALILAAKSQASVIFADSPLSADLRTIVEVPVLIVVDAPAESDGEPEATFSFGVNVLGCSSHSKSDQEEVMQWESALGEWDLTEPFARIQEAIEETQKAA